MLLRFEPSVPGWRTRCPLVCVLTCVVLLFSLGSGVGDFRLPPVNALNIEASTPHQGSALKLADRVGSKSEVHQTRDQLEIPAQPDLIEARRLRARGTLESSCQSITQYKEALSHLQSPRDRRTFAITLKELGQVYDSLDESQEALSSFRQAIIVSRDLKDTTLEIELLNEAGQLLVDLGEPDDATLYASRALRLSETSGNRKGLAWASNIIGDAHYNLGNLKRSLEDYRRAHDISLELNDGTGQIRALVSFGYAYVDLSESSKAFESYRQALSLSKLNTLPHWEAITLRAIGNLQTKVGENQKAIDLFLQAQAILKSFHNRHLQATVWAGLAYAYEAIGERQRALEYYMQALAMFQLIRHAWGEAETRMDAGRIFHTLGDHGQAMTHYNHALSLFRELKMQRYQAQTLRDMGLVHDSQGNTAKALDCYKQSLRLTRSGQDQRYEAYTLNYIGRAYQEAGSPRRAIAHYRKALLLNRLASDPAGESLTHFNLAQAERDLNQLTQARREIESALVIVESLRSKVTSTVLRASYFATVRQQFDLYIDILMRMDQLDPNRGLAEAAFSVSERARARSLLESLDEARSEIRQGVEPHLLTRERALRRELDIKADRRMQLIADKRDDEVAALAQELRQLNTQYDQIQAQIKLTSPRYAALTQPQPLTLKAVQQQVLDDDTLLLGYYLADEGSYLWAVTRDEVSSYRLPPRLEIENAARDLYESITANQPVPRETFEQRQERSVKADAVLPAQISKLSNILIGPVSAKLTTQRLLVVSDGTLQYIPFQILTKPLDGSGAQVNGDQGIPLVTHHEIINEPSASALALLHSEALNRTPARNSVAVLADPVFEDNDPRVDSTLVRASSATIVPRPNNEMHRALRDVGLARDGVGIPRLPSSRDEANAIMSVVPWRTGFSAVGFEASRATAMRADLADYRIVHFATHGLLNNEHPELSGIVLSLVDKKGQPQDGFLRLHDIYNLKLPVDLVVLSACNTGLGKDVRGEGLVGLTRGFMYAGASSVVASLWKVDDEATAELMKHFYSALFKERLAPAAALRTAQLKMAREERWRSPYYWSGFIIQGQYLQTVYTEPATNISVALKASVILMVAAALLFALRQRLRALL